MNTTTTDLTTSSLSGQLLAELDRAGSEHTAREIAQQPAVWRKLAGVIAEHKAEIAAKIAPLVARRDVRIILTGAGTSAFVGDALAPALSARLGRAVEAIATTDIVANPRGVFAGDQPTLLVSFARSGNSPESIAATELADQCLSEVHQLIVTCNAEGQLAQGHAHRKKSLVLQMPAETNDKSFAMTSSFSSMLLSAWLTLSGANSDEVAATCELVANAGQELLMQSVGETKYLAFTKPGRIVYLGSGALAGIAKEAGLKILELTAGDVVPWSDTSLGFRHGPKSILDDSTLAVMFVSTDPYTRQYDLDMAREMQIALAPGRLLVLSAQPTAVAGALNWTLPGLASAPDIMAGLVAILVPQTLALYSSVQLGRTPDNPFPGGSVNRVVQGVTIYPLENR